LIALSGLDPEKDIEIKFTGPRPGEKISEELLNPETRILPTSHEKIMVVETDSVDPERVQRGIQRLLAHAVEGDDNAVYETLRSLVPEYGRAGTRPDPPSDQSRILVVEQDGYTRTTLKRVLESRYHVLEASDRRRALCLVKEQKPDLIILNYDLPGVNIRRLCARIREGNGRIPIILLIESAEVASLQQILDLGADDRLYKPIPVHILETRVKRLLEVQKEER
jgi:CheY-like chemotaxis protein